MDVYLRENADQLLRNAFHGHKERGRAAADEKVCRADAACEFRNRECEFALSDNVDLGAAFSCKADVFLELSGARFALRSAYVECGKSVPVCVIQLGSGAYDANTARRRGEAQKDTPALPDAVVCQAYPSVMRVYFSEEIDHSVKRIVNDECQKNKPGKCKNAFHFCFLLPD